MLPIDAEFAQRQKINNVDVITVPLSKLRADVYVLKGSCSLPVGETPISKYLETGDESFYAEYHKMVKEKYNPNDTHNIEDFNRLFDNIKENGYDQNNLIVVFGDDMVIRDGQNRAAILWHLHGDISVKIAKAIR